MKYLIGAIFALMLLVSAAMGNQLYQSNTANANGAGACGELKQTELNAALAIGQDNLIGQANTQNSDTHDGFLVDQDSINLALALGTKNTIGQSNIANANGGVVDQNQLNVAAVLGHENVVGQANKANANEARVGGPKENKITQCQTNLGLVIGLGNTLGQSNLANGIIPKTCKTDPCVIQSQMNIGVLISKSKCHEEPEEPPVEPPEENPCTCPAGWEQYGCSCPK